MYWVLGKGGLLGSAIARVSPPDQWNPINLDRFMWSDLQVLSEQFSIAIEAFIENAQDVDQWQIYWCAGGGIVSATQDVLEQDVKIFELFLKVLRIHLNLQTASKGIVFFASSAGGVYGGQTDPPFSEFSSPSPKSQYGVTKLLQEEILTDFSHEHGLRSVIGRISNIYGAGQQLTKSQGLVSNLLLADMQRHSAKIFVPLHVTRDLIYVDDLAELICHSTHRFQNDTTSIKSSLIKIFCSGTNISIAHLVSEIQRITKRPLRYTTAVNTETSLQPIELRFKTEIYQDLQNLIKTPIPVGLKKVHDDILLRIANP